MINPSQPPEGILDPQQPWWPTKNIGEVTWRRLKAKLTGRKDEYGTQYSSFVNLAEADADRLIENIKKYGQYPQVNQNGKDGGYSNLETYQKWLVEEFLEKPFREQVDKKIEEKQIESRLKEIQETKNEVKEAETKEEVAAVIDDKIEVLEEIREQVAPPRSEYQIPDPWEGSYTTPKSQAKAKKTKKRINPKGSGRPVGTLTKTRRRKKKASAGGPPPNSPPPKRSFASKMGGGLRKAGTSLGKTIIDKLESGGPLGENMGPSVIGAGIWIGKKINKAFQDAKKERARAIEAEKNGAEVPPEVKEKGYFIKKSLAYQFGGETLNKTVGAFFENIPSKQSKQKAGFTDTFDYGDADPKKKKDQNDIKDLATGFRKVTTALRGINRSINQQISLMSSLVSETSRVADTLEAIQNSIAKQIDVEIQTDADEAQAQQATGGGDINIGDINLDAGGSEFDWLDALFMADDIRDIRKNMKDRGGQKTTRRKPKITGDVTPKRRFRMPSFGRRMKFSQGTAGVSTQVPAMIGEAGPELLMRGGMKKLAEGGVMQGTGSNILATGLGAAGDLMKKVQPFASVMEIPLKVVGSQISGALSSLVSAAGPFSGAIAKMFSPLLGGLASIFGLNQGAFAAEINSAAMTEKEGAKELSRFFANFFKIFGFKIGDDKANNPTQTPTVTPQELTGTLAEKSKQFAEYLMSKHGLADFQAAAIVGTMIREGFGSGKPDVREGGERGAPTYDGTSRMGYGWLQWTNTQGGGPNDRLNRALIHLGMGPPPKQTRPWTDADNISVMEYEWSKHYTRTLPSVKKAKNIEEAVYEFVGNYTAGSHANISSYQNREDKSGGGFIGRRNSSAAGVLKLLQGDGNAKIRAKGGVDTITSSFSNQVNGVYEMIGKDTGYKVPEYLTGGQPVIGHGLEWLIKLSNKFIIIPGVNKEYNVYKDPEKAFNRYKQIGSQAGVEVAGFVGWVDNLLFKTSTGAKVEYKSGPRDAIEAIGGRYYKPYAPDPSFKPVRGASLPEGTVTPVAIPKDTVTGTTGAVVAMIQPVVVERIVTVPGPERVEYVPANPFIAAKIGIDLLDLQRTT